MTTIKCLEWDSHFFGYPVASATWSALPPKSDLDDVLENARASGFRLLYLFLPPTDTPLRLAIEYKGAKFVGCKVEYAKQITSPPAWEDHGQIQRCNANNPQLEALALHSGTYSRFHLDEGFRQQEFERLYREWLASSLRGDMGKLVYIVGTPTEPRGLLTLESDENIRIGLIAVEPSRHGQGIGRQLISMAEQFCIQHQKPELRVATQENNIEACRFYEHCGFRNISKTDVFHAWFPPD